VGPLHTRDRGDRMNQAAPNPRPWLTLAVVGAAFFMTVLDVAIVNVAIPSIQKDLNIAESTVQWVITAYAITFGGFLLLGGRMSDLLGRRRIFIAGLVLFTLASLACGFAWSAGVLIVSRAVQGLGGAILSPAASPEGSRCSSMRSRRHPTSAGERPAPSG